MKTGRTALERFFGKPASEITNEELENFLRTDNTYEKVENRLVSMTVCGCGCGQPMESHNKWGRRRKYLHGHNKGNFKTGKRYNSQGYILVLQPDHPNADSDGYVREHILVMEAKLGRYLEPGETVHHTDGSKDNNHPDNLEVFDSPGIHHSHHAAAKAFEACGKSHWRRCCICHQYDDPDNMTLTGSRMYHKKCNTEYYKNRRNNIK